MYTRMCWTYVSVLSFNPGSASPSPWAHHPAFLFFSFRSPDPLGVQPPTDPQVDPPQNFFRAQSDCTWHLWHRRRESLWPTQGKLEPSPALVLKPRGVFHPNGCFPAYKQGLLMGRGRVSPISEAVCLLSLHADRWPRWSQDTAEMGYLLPGSSDPMPSSAFISHMTLGQLLRFWEPQLFYPLLLRSQNHTVTCWIAKFEPRVGYFVLWMWTGTMPERSKEISLYLSFQRGRQHSKDDLFFSSLSRKSWVY